MYQRNNSLISSSVLVCSAGNNFTKSYEILLIMNEINYI